MASIDIDAVIAKVKDDSGRLTVDDDFQPAIDAALERYNGHRPKEIVVDVVGNGTHDIALPDDWVDEYSHVRQVEYPVDQVPENLLGAYEWKLYRNTTGLVLRLVDVTPEATESVRLTITVPREADEVRIGDVDAVSALAASFCCDTLANLYASTSDPTISADVVNYRSKSSEWAKRAKDLRKLYLDHIGIDEDGGAPAAMTTVPPPDGGYGLTHWRR